MNKQLVLDDMVANGKMTRADANRAFDQTFTSLDNVLSTGAKVRVTSFGTFTRGMTPGRTDRNPATGETMTIQPRMATKFKESRPSK